MDEMMDDDEFYDEFDVVQSAAKREREGDREGDREMMDDPPAKSSLSHKRRKTICAQSLKEKPKSESFIRRNV
jgi:hypothetical protein